MKKLMFTVLLFILSAVYVKATVINKIYIDAETEIAGGLRVKELIKVSDQDGPLKINIFYKDKSLSEFKSDEESLYGSSIYNGSGVQINNIGRIKDKADIEKYTEDSFYKDNAIPIEKVYEDDGEYYIITLPDNKGDNIYYLDYTVLNILVEHKDSAELYYRYIDKFNYDVESITVITKLPYHSNLFKVWAHGSKNTKVSIDGKSSIVHNEIADYKKGEYLDNRVLFDLDLFVLNINENKKSNMEAVDLIESIENERLNNIRTSSILKVSFIVSIIVLMLFIAAFIIYKFIKKTVKKLHNEIINKI